MKKKEKQKDKKMKEKIVSLSSRVCKTRRSIDTRRVSPTTRSPQELRENTYLEKIKRNKNMYTHIHIIEQSRELSHPNDIQSPNENPSDISINLICHGHNALLRAREKDEKVR